VKLRSYRVFGKGAEGASNYAIAKAIDRAVADGCDLINMSLGGGGVDEATRAAIEDARARGTAVLAAAGNDGRQAVSFPASDSMALAVSAMGRMGTFPSSATEAGEVALPKGADPKNFIAAFSNVGPEIDLTGPGLGIVSTVPEGYGVMSGTSMACPAAAGAAARLLAARAEILGMPRGQARSDAVVALVLQAAKSVGFGASFEGSGLLPG
jgi:subtilisin family serine protease